MDAILVYPQNRQYAQALKALAKALDMPFEVSKKQTPDTTEWLLSSPTNRTRLQESIKQAENTL